MNRFKHALCVLMLLPCILHAAFWDWQSLESDHYILYYQSDFETQALEWLHRLETDRSHVEKHSQLVSPKIPVVLEDAGLFANGNVTVFPPRMRLYMGGAAAHESFHVKNWSRLLVTHEAAHVAHLNEVSAHAKTVYKLFGTFFLPNAYAPHWFIEGYATDMESLPITVDGEEEPYPQGRLHDGYFSNILAYQAKELSLYSLEFISSNLPNRYPRGYTYIYGSSFLQYLRQQYGEQSVTNFIKQQGSNIFSIFGLLVPNITLDRAAKKHFGKPFHGLYKEWTSSLEREHNDWAATGTQLTQNGFQKGFLLNRGKQVYYTDQMLYHHNPLEITPVYRLMKYNPDTKQHHILKSLTSPIIAPLRFHEGFVYYLQVEIEPGYANLDLSGFGYVSTLYQFNIYTGKSTKIHQDEIRAFTILEDGRILFTKSPHGSIKSELWILQEGVATLIGEIPYFVSELVTHKDDIYMIAKRQNYSFNIYNLSLTSLTATPVLETPWTISHLSTYEDMLVFTANKNKTHSTYSFDPSNQALTLLTDSDYANAGVLTPDYLYFFSLGKKGEELFHHPHYSLTETLESEKTSPFMPTLFSGANSDTKGFEKSLNNLARPYNIVFPTLLSGADDLGMHDYAVAYDTTQGLVLTATSKLFVPTLIGVSNINETTFLTLEHPLHRSLQSGIQDASLTLRTDFDEFTPGLRIKYGLPQHSTNIFVQSDLVNDGFFSQARHEYFWGHNQSISAMISHSNEMDTFIRVRGDTLGIVDNADGLAGSIQYQQNIYSFRKGFWAPSIYGGDLFGVLFYDYADVDNVERTSYGVQAKLETSAFLGNFRFIPSLGYAYIDSKLNLFSEVEFTLRF